MDTLSHRRERFGIGCCPSLDCGDGNIANGNDSSESGAVLGCEGCPRRLLMMDKKYIKSSLFGRLIGELEGKVESRKMF